jgi:hypothetical protein
MRLVGGLICDRFLVARITRQAYYSHLSILA